MVRAWILWLALWVAVAGCHSQTVDSASIPQQDMDSRLGVGDVIDIRVFGEDSLNNSYQIGHDGTIDFPLLGPVTLTGLAPNEAARLLQTQLRERHFFLDPQVSIFVKEVKSKRVSVIGAVARPGTFTMREGLTVVELITEAGGFTPVASRNSVMLTRNVNGKTMRYRIRVDDITNGKGKDVPVSANDIIFVPDRAF